jgi:RNA polymerase sigma-70 factor, ECF subfamily
MCVDSRVDGYLVSQAVAGVPRALDRLLLDHYAPLAARIERKVPALLRASIATEDIVQETFTDAFRRIGSFRPEGKDAFYRWLTAIADNRLTDAIRACTTAKRGGRRNATHAANQPHAARSSIAAIIDLVAINDWTPSRSAGGHEVAAAVQVALAGLKPEYREALRLRFIEGLSIADVARRLGRTEPSVHKLCSRGLQALRETLGEATEYFSRG